MTPPNKKKRKYGLLEQKGQRSKILICLALGKENVSSISRRILRHRKYRLTYVKKYLQELEEKKFIFYDRKVAKNKFIHAFSLDLYKFFISKSQTYHNISFSQREKSFLKKMIEKMKREEIVFEAMQRQDGDIFDSIALKLSEFLIKDEILFKNLKLGFKVQILLMNSKNSLINSQRIGEMGNKIELEIIGDSWYEDYFNEKLQITYEGVCLQNPKTREFCMDLLKQEVQNKSGEKEKKYYKKMAESSLKAYLKDLKKKKKLVKTKKGAERLKKEIARIECILKPSIQKISHTKNGKVIKTIKTKPTTPKKTTKEAKKI